MTLSFLCDFVRLISLEYFSFAFICLLIFTDLYFKCRPLGCLHALEKCLAVATMFHLGLIFGLMELLIFFPRDINNDLSFKSSVSQLVSVPMVSSTIYILDEIHFGVHAR